MGIPKTGITLSQWGYRQNGCQSRAQAQNRLINPLTRLDKVCHSPHIAGQTAESLVRMSVQTAENILTVLRGEMLDPGFVVNPEALR